MNFILVSNSKNSAVLIIDMLTHNGKTVPAIVQVISVEGSLSDASGLYSNAVTGQSHPGGRFHSAQPQRMLEKKMTCRSDAPSFAFENQHIY